MFGTTLVSTRLNYTTMSYSLSVMLLYSIRQTHTQYQKHKYGKSLHNQILCNKATSSNFGLSTAVTAHNENTRRCKGTKHIQTITAGFQQHQSSGGNTWHLLPKCKVASVCVNKMQRKFK